MEHAEHRDDALWVAILGKQIGKVSAITLDQCHATPHTMRWDDLAPMLRDKLVNVAAVAVAWHQAITSPDLSLADSIQYAAQRIVAERSRQELKFGIDGTCASDVMSGVHKFAVLAEEYGEAAADVNELRLKESGGVYKGTATTDTLCKELIQVAAVAVAWIESIDYLP